MILFQELYINGIKRCDPLRLTSFSQRHSFEVAYVGLPEQCFISSYYRVEFHGTDVSVCVTIHLLQDV